VECKDDVDPVLLNLDELEGKCGIELETCPILTDKRDSILDNWLAILLRLREVRIVSCSNGSDCWNRFSSLPRVSTVTFPYPAISSTLP
jgi:hypothetical protein